VLALTGPPPLRRRGDGFGTLLGAIVSQQVSVASADAVWRRLEAAGLTVPEAIAAAGDEALRACGLSRQKASYARALAERASTSPACAPARQRGGRGARPGQGIGVWTAEIYAMFSLGRADVFAPGDLALQEAARLLFDLPARPTEKAMRAQSLAWSPWRAVAARLLWAYYQAANRREGVR
jgi:DNA-3-methyladenine glycosylase II